MAKKVSYEEMVSLLEAERQAEKSTTCAYGAPVFAVPTNTGKWKLIPGNCHHWDCPKCGPQIARKNYGRMVKGVETGESLYLLTLTARGGGISKRDAEENWLLWSNRLFTQLRADARARGIDWKYASVTERQKRGHPHSHTIMSWYPADGKLKQRYEITSSGRQLLWYDDEKTIPKVTMRSAWLREKVTRAGFGEIYDISPIASAKAASRYIAKYLFKSVMFERWPEKWRRVRYSNSWPKLGGGEKVEGIVPLLTDGEFYQFTQKHEGRIIHDDAEIDARLERTTGKYELRDTAAAWSSVDNIAD